MKRVLPSLRLAVVGLALTTASLCQAQTLPANTVQGRLGISPGPAQSIPFATLAANLSGALGPLVTGSGTSTVGCAAPWANTTGSLLGNNCDISLSGSVASITAIQNSGTGFPLSTIFAGDGGTANFWLSQSGIAASATVPEIGGQFTMTSNVGLANAGTAFKIALTSSVGGSTGSANIYGFNTIASGYAGAGGYLITGAESDVNNAGANAHTLGGSTASYGFVAAMAGTFDNTAGFWVVSNATPKWQYGFAATGHIGLADFYSGSTASYGLELVGTYGSGVINTNVGFAVTNGGDVVAAALYLPGTSTGTTILVGENTGSSNYVLTLPNLTDTIATLTATQTLTNKTIAFASNTLTGVAPLASPSFTGVVNVPAGSATAPSLSIGNATTGDYSVSTTGWGVSVNGTSIIDSGITAGGYLAIKEAVYLVGNTVIGGGIFTAGSSSGYELNSNGATGTAPTLIPNQADTKAGIGADTSGDVSIVTDNAGTATEVERHTGTATAINTATITLPNITTDTAVTDASLCGASTGRRVYYGSGTLGICLGTSSFAAAKNDINTISNGLEQISALRPVNYFYKNGFGDNGAREQYGFIAEEYAKALPNLSRFDSVGNPTGVDMYGLVPVIVSSVKEIIDSCRVAANDNFCAELLKRVH